jgi:hypothetical protein
MKNQRLPPTAAKDATSMETLSRSRKRRQMAPAKYGIGSKNVVCITCNHFAAKAGCLFRECRRCCGKNGRRRCPVHEAVYQKERRILLAKLRLTHKVEDLLQNISGKDFTEGTFSYAGDSCVIFTIGTYFCIPEVQKWIHRLDKSKRRKE